MWLNDLYIHRPRDLGQTLNGLEHGWSAVLANNSLYVDCRATS